MKDSKEYAELSHLKRLVLQSTAADEQKEEMVRSVRTIEKEMHRLNFQLERDMKEKRTLSTLLARTSEDLEKSSELIKKMFGRYLSNEVMNSLLDDPGALALGGEKRTVTIMVTDLRGFTALAERLKPEQVVQILNAYFEVMVDVILQHHGTINEIIGDSLLVIFGAPQALTDRTQRAIACAIDMQNAMARVNERNSREGLPLLEMGIGINDTEVVVGNIGSSKRSKYAVVGSGVNVTSRIESYSVGGQILVSDSVLQEAGQILRVDSQQDVIPKGMEASIRIYGIGGIAGHYNLALENKPLQLRTLARKIPIHCTMMDGKSSEEKIVRGDVIRLSADSATVLLNAPVGALTNLKMELDGVDEKLSARRFYGKVIRAQAQEECTYLIRFTSLSPEIDAYFQAHLRHATD